MAYTRPKDLDGFFVHLSKPDTKFRQQLGVDLLSFLAEPSNPIDCQDIGLFVDGLIPWMQSSNYKVSTNGIEVLTYLIDRLGTDFKPYIQTVLPNVIDRLGDAKDTVREKAQILLLKLLERNVLTPQILIEKLHHGFTHKNAKIREEVLRCLVNTLNEYGAQSLTLNKFIPEIVNLLSDPTVTVRDTAFNTLVDLYKHVGEKLRIDLQKRNIVPQAKWNVLSVKFDEVKARGELLPSASKGIDFATDETDKAVMARPIIPVKRQVLGTAIKQRSGLSAGTGSTSSAGAVDEETFIKSFEDCPTVQIFSFREVSEHLKNIQDIISDANKDWNKRVDALKKIRSLCIAGATNHEEFYVGLKNLEIPLQGTLKDLRSQVVREACITISYLSQILRNKFDKTSEMLLQHLINLIQNSAKVMASSGQITVKFIIQNIHSSRLIPIITSNCMKSKSKEIRRACCEFLELILTQWPKQPLERHIPTLQEAVKSGIADADPDARVSSRRAFKGFKEHFPDQAEHLVQSLDPSYRRALHGEGMSASSSHSNIASGFKTPKASYRSATHSGTDSVSKGFRSNSAIDLQAAQRAKARAQYSAIARNKIQFGTASLQGEVAQQARPKRAPDPVVTSSPERMSRTRNRNSQSQPTSRSGSPNSRLGYMYHRVTDHESSPRPRKLSSGIPRSTQGSRDTSRETSPNRSLNRFRRAGDRPPPSPASRPVLAQKILQQSREAENALADVFNSSDHYRGTRKNIRSVDNQSDESETSSVCSERSERSFDSFRRPCDSYSWSGSQQRLSRDLWEPSRDINQIIALCASTNWQERKDGLLSLQYYLSTEIPLTPGELKHLTEIFTRMFMDSHTKGLSVFLDTLNEIIRSYKSELEFWLYVLLQRVFVKIGTETLSSIQGKLMSTLDLIKISFPGKLLIANVYRFLIDATQTPNTKVKNVVLNTLSSLCNDPDNAQYISQSPASQALQKIITYAQDTKSAETRHAAKQCIVALWNCNTPQVTMLLAELPKEQQDLASNVVHSHMRKSSTGSEPGSPMAIASPKPLSPGVSPLRDGLDQEEFHRRLRRTTAEIQNYSFEAISSKLDRDRDTTSQDSGISQMSAGNDVARDERLLEEQMEELSIRPNFAIRSGSRSLPYSAVNGETDTNSFRSLGEIKDAEQIISDIIQNCCSPIPNEEKCKMLSQLHDLIKNGQTEYIKKNFKKILRILINALNEKDTMIQVTALQTLRTVFQTEDLKDCWNNFIELITMKVLEAHNDEKREVMKEAELTAAAMTVGPFEKIVETVAPIISTSHYPPLLGAIKMLAKLVEAHPNEVADEHLSKIMPGLIKGTDHTESPVRKSSIFCMVALHKAVGEQRLSSYITHLSGSKIKLLRLYIDRSEHNSVSSTTKNNGS
ncbi:CLIP-associating protein isoform X3 [Diorhabda sublineata]|uniref:CLIP-associating protein isoform X3 n=1 Tax=Diorhabda sublineata TaxID=1163346 RepID=UPI0024E16426|nr:CLIP-associating protein isoform X3 [Diorhabda sublineata]